ncbi:MarR family transcriptional regulator [Pseudidiomarina aestuarii]|uniref:MarR family transcriptional regulator n=1 Tax=Pseudidiomarina aestuarii TaxID=624146 RepID=A0A7Z7ESX7_9GAMM|nr:MarR family transcriptional regulator [Pseudidiomarina aestuarii]RUO39477.1 MarR family transcriptional regulator [Pseudidiomarina aestuarii]
MTSRVTLPLNEQLCFAMYCAANSITRMYRPILEPFGLTYAQYVVMLALWHGGKMRMGNLSAETQFDSGTLTPLVRKLEDKGLLQRSACQNDDRVKFVELTQAGADLERRMSGVAQQMRCQMALTDEQMASMRELSHRLKLGFSDAEYQARRSAR